MDHISRNFDSTPGGFAHAHDCPSTTEVDIGGPFGAVDFSEKAQAVQLFIFPRVIF